MSTSNDGFKISLVLPMTMKALIDSIFKPQVPVEPEPEKPKIPDYVVDSDYKLAAYTALIGPLIIILSPGKSPLEG